ncbi:MAG TPA: LytTR family DNA-binding domain-containing protein, partial [Saprospiraceae bacterium]|nr:LytTR family DNA-binding domain-containing protein [Saprospiraceae bacterium]
MKAIDIHPRNPTISNLIEFPCKGQRLAVETDNIISLQADSNYTYVHTDSGQSFLMAKVLKEYEVIFKPFNFIRISRSTLV